MSTLNVTALMTMMCVPLQRVVEETLRAYAMVNVMFGIRIRVYCITVCVLGESEDENDYMRRRQRRSVT